MINDLNRLFMIVIATLLVSGGAFLGLITLFTQELKLKNSLLHLVSISAGTLMGSAFFHLLPEALGLLPVQATLMVTLASFIGFFAIEKILHWRHCHKGHCKVHQFGYMNLIGDAIHNFVDGLVIAGAFIVEPALGWVTTLAVASHEIPQEISDFGVLVYSGFSKKSALLMNVGVALTAVLGGIIGYILGGAVETLAAILLPAAAGGFLYIAASDLMPEIRKETDQKKSYVAFSLFLIGVALMYGLTLIGIE